MIELTVKTLDSQNHQFTVEDDITVEQFKVKIAETVNIPADTQRIIYCGKVLQDTSKLADYDVHGKVVHLVQRAPPGSTPRPSSRSTSPQPPRRTFRGFRAVDPGNSMYLASMAFPGNLMETQGIIPPPPTHNLSSSRLSVARRMLRRAEAVISLLENPNARPQDQNNTEENQEEEVTTVFEARVVVPTIVNQRMNNVYHVVRRNENDEPIEIGIEYPAVSGISAPAGPLPRAASAENLSTETRSENTPNTLPENASPTSEMAELLTTLGQLQTRFAPFLDRYHRFMQEDPEVPEEIHRETQTMLNRVSEVLHFLGHAYHSMSDIMVRARAPPPRPLLCRPILIQHSAVLQTGIPIQVEVSSQINLPTDRQTTSNSNQTSTTASSLTSSTTTSSTASTSEVTAASTTAASTTSSTSTTQSGSQSISVPPAFVGLPFLPGTMRVQSFPVEIRSVRSSSAPPRAQNNNNNTVTTAASTSSTVTSSAPTSTSSASRGPAGNQEGSQNAGFNFNNPNVEFFMEVTPEGITIDSLETTLVDSNRANDLLRGALDGPSPDFLQSLMQMAGQIMSRNLTPAASTAPSSSANTTTAESTATTGAQAAAGSAGQNSQARGNTQTNPTTATHTRSTPRPHVHLAQQAMQGGFDPFLPCNSHHISRRNRMQTTQMDMSENAIRGPQTFTLRPNTSRNEVRGSTQNTSSNSRTTPLAQSSNTQTNNHQDIANFIQNIFESVRTESRSSDPDRNRRFGDGLQESSNLPILGALLSGISGRNMFRESQENLTLEQFLREGQEDVPYVAGESILGDLQMLLFRNLSLIDMVTLSSGSSAPIHRFLPDIRNFIQTRVCNGDTTQNGIDRGVEVILTEIRPSLQTFNSAPCNDDTDIVRSIEELLRQRLPNIINIGLNLNNYSVTQLIVQCVTTVKQILALFLYVVRSQGHSGYEQVVNYLLNRMLIEIPHNPAVFPFSLLRIQFREYLRNLNVPNSVLQPYLVRSLDGNRTTAQNGRPEGTSETRPGDSTQTDNVDTMEIDDQVAAGSSNLTSQGLNNSEPLSNILIGSERWRNQVPEGWLPMIARDAQRQRRQNPPTTFSDTYLASMPSKRRKLVNNSKPQDSLPQVISDTVREAVTATGLEGIAPLDTVADEAGASTEIQAAYRSLLRTTVQASLEDNEDFVPERFPNVANYFNKDLQ